MYRPAIFREDRRDVLCALMRRAPLATIVIHTDEGLSANLVPLLLREQASGLVLAGHVARSNTMRALPVVGEVLVLFAGPAGYVSPSAYPSKKDGGEVVPTWNYIAVQARGRLRWIEDDAWLERLLEELTDEHESPRAEPWRVSDAPPAFTRELRAAVVGLEIEVTRLEGKLKLGQNRTRADREGVIAELRERGDGASLALADAMQAVLDRRPPAP
jgi:transcriptional regulator